jgi:hypothetical protein
MFPIFMLLLGRMPHGKRRWENTSRWEVRDVGCEDGCRAKRTQSGPVTDCCNGGDEFHGSMTDGTQHLPRWLAFLQTLSFQ